MACKMKNKFATSSNQLATRSIKHLYQIKNPACDRLNLRFQNECNIEMVTELRGVQF